MNFSLLSKLKTFLTHPLVRDLDIDSPEAVSVHNRLIQEKPFLKAIYKEWYTEISNFLLKISGGPVLEIGSGGGFLKEFVPDLITSEVLQTPNVDMVLDGHDLPFKKNSLNAIVMVDVFHHLKNVKLFMDSAAYCMKPGGVLAMVEPWNTPWSRIILKYFHHEPFDPDTKEWNFPEGGHLSQSNQALPWIVFYRDRAKLEREHTEWRLRMLKVHMPFSYLLSGGVSYRSFLPGSLFNVWQKIEGIFNPWINFWGMFASISLVRKDND